jgi:hypothetical protein
MPAQTTKNDLAQALLEEELSRLGKSDLAYILCFSDAAWRDAMHGLGCPAYIARLASPTTRRSTRGKLGMATICHFKHGHEGVVYVRTHGRTWEQIDETVRHEALHLARPSFSHRQIHRELHGEELPARPRRRRKAPAKTAAKRR